MAAFAIAASRHGGALEGQLRAVLFGSDLTGEGLESPQVGPCPDFVERPLLAEAAFEVGACL